MRTLRNFALLLTLLAPLANAQDIRGTVRDNGSGQPVSGAIVMVLDSSRVLLARTLTNARGEYELRRAPEARVLRTLRLGFRPTELVIPASATPTVRLDVVITAVPVTLDPVRTIAAAQCPKRPDSQAALSLLEQVRTGLLATVVARAASPAFIHRFEVIKTRNMESDNVMSMTVVADSAETTNAYVAALSAQAFVSSGFANDTSGMLTTYGPDAEVLMDEAFANGYCFRLAEAQPSRPRQIGLAFNPAATRRGRVDIDGVLWVDTAAKALVDIEFLYRGFSRTFDAGRPGGHIEFRTMPNGVVMIDRWFLRVPSRRPRQAADGRRITVLPGDFVIEETGGELASSRWPDGTTWRASLGGVRLHLTDRRGKPDSGRVIRLDSTTYVARSDSAGIMEFKDLVPGPYNMSLVDGRLIQIGVKIPIDQTFSAMRDSVFNMPITTMTAEERVLELCPDGKGVGESIVIGGILEADGSPANNVEVVIDRTEPGQELVRMAEGIRTGSNGVFTWCKLARGMHVVISASRDGVKRTVEVPNLERGLTVLRFKLKEER